MILAEQQYVLVFAAVKPSERNGTRLKVLDFAAENLRHMHPVRLIPNRAPSNDPAARTTNDETIGACIKGYARDILGLVDLESECLLPFLRKVSTHKQVRKFETYALAVPPAENITVRGAAVNHVDRLIHPPNAQEDCRCTPNTGCGRSCHHRQPFRVPSTGPGRPCV